MRVRGLKRHLALTIAALLAVANLAPAGSPLADQPRTLTVFAAASLADAFTDLGHRLEAQRPGLAVRFNFAGSQQLATQIEQGARADVFASADERWMSYVADRRLLSGEPVEFARNRLAVIVPATNPARIRRLQDLRRGGVKLVLAADAVPVGRYSRTVLQNLSGDPAYGEDFARRVLGNVVSEEENVRSVVGKVQLGEADAGMVYRSDVTPAVARRVHVLEIPPAANVLASYPIARLRASRAPEAAQAFVDLVLSPGGQQVLARRGLIPIAEAPAAAP
jgi:molybdate transport system substrate-binding protein